jgi:hypothetical protein
MRKLVLARTVLALIGVAVWGYGYRYELPNVRLAAMGILAVALLLRFVPTRWLGDDSAP